MTIQDRTEVRTPTGNTRFTWFDAASNVEARVLPLAVSEGQEQWFTPEEDAYEVQLRGAQPSLRPRMRVVVGADYYDIRHVLQPPPFGTPTTVLQTVKVTP